MAHTLTITKSKAGVNYSRSLDFILSTLRDGEYTLTIERKKSKRTLSQNALMWMWFTCISRETGQPVQDVHDTYCARFLARTAVTPRGDIIRVYGQTSKLSTVEMTQFMNEVQEDAAEMGIILPLPEDAYYDDFLAEYKNIMQ